MIKLSAYCLLLEFHTGFWYFVERNGDILVPVPFHSVLQKIRLV